MIYVVTLYRYGNRKSHSYVLGTFDNEKLAIEAALEAENWRSGQYTSEVLMFELNQTIPTTVLRLERHNPLDLESVWRNGDSLLNLNDDDTWTP